MQVQALGPDVTRQRLLHIKAGLWREAENGALRFTAPKAAPAFGKCSYAVNSQPTGINQRRGEWPRSPASISNKNQCRGVQETGKRDEKGIIEQSTAKL